MLKLRHVEPLPIPCWSLWLVWDAGDQVPNELECLDIVGVRDDGSDGQLFCGSFVTQQMAFYFLQLLRMGTWGECEQSEGPTLSYWYPNTAHPALTARLRRDQQGNPTE